MESARALLARFESTYITQIDSSDNSAADALSKVALEGVLPDGVSFIHLVSMHNVLYYVMEIGGVDSGDEDDWHTLIIDYMLRNTLPTEEVIEKRLKACAANYKMIQGSLYKRSFTHPLLKCIGPGESSYILQETHEGVGSAHEGAYTLFKKFIRHW